MDTNSYINSKLEYCKPQEKGYHYLDENIKEFYQNYLTALNCIPNIYIPIYILVYGKC